MHFQGYKPRPQRGVFLSRGSEEGGKWDETGARVSKVQKTLEKQVDGTRLQGTERSHRIHSGVLVRRREGVKIRTVGVSVRLRSINQSN